MALFAIIRKLQIHRSRPLIRLSQVSHYFISSPSAVNPALYISSQAFHQTSSRLSKRNSHSVGFNHVKTQSPYQIINFDEFKDEAHENIQLGFDEILETIQKAKDFASGDEAMIFLDNSGVKPDKDVIFSIIWALREEWKVAFLVFKWGEKWGCVVEKTWCLMVWLLGNHKKFSTAWTVIHGLYHASVDTQQAMLVLIDRYVAAHNVDKAIETFHMLQKFKFSPDQNTYFIFLNILCKHGNIEEAEEFMYLNKKFFPLETESFNIILNGWCNIVIDIYEAKRVWREMSKCCIEPDGTSYTHMISCNSRVVNLFESLRLYDVMKKMNYVPGLEVYHSLVFILTRENCLSEALKIVNRMKETDLSPNSTTYNLIIKPLSEAAKFEEARTILVRMLGDGISPTIDTYHALLEGESLEGTFGVLNHMKEARLGPSMDTFLCILNKFFRLGQPENALKIWLEMKKYMVKPDFGHYYVMVQGLAKCGLIVKAREFYTEMISVGIVDDPFLKKLVEEPKRNKVRARKGKRKITIVRSIKKSKGLRGGNCFGVQSRRRRKQVVKNRTS